MLKKTVLVALVVPWCAAAAFGEEKIEGAFGFKLGQTFQPTTPLIASEDEFHFPEVYRVTPDAPNPAFAAYYVGITPTTHVIYEIIAIGKSTPGEAGVQAEESLKAYLRAKYGTGPLNLSGDEIRQDKRVIHFGGAHNPARTITNVIYTDGVLYALALQEAAQQKAAQEAERARQLIKTFDGTGL